MLEIKDVEAEARDVIDSLREMITDEGTVSRYQYNAHVETCECCAGTGVEPVEKEQVRKLYPHQGGWTSIPALCTACGGEGNYVLSHDKEDPEESWDAGRY